MIEVATCSYGEFQGHMGLPIRTSRGEPKWFAYETVGWENVYPKYHWLKMPRADYEPRYLAMLDKIGPDVLRGDLIHIASMYAQLHDGELPPRLVLCCFEKLSKGPSNWCHRTMLAGWLQRNLDMKVVELGAEPAVPIDPEPTLF